jgi:hypothetical protein
MQNIELQKMGLVALEYEDCETINGGNPFWGIFLEAIRHFDEIAAGMEKGWNFDKQKK